MSLHEVMQRPLSFESLYYGSQAWIDQKQSVAKSHQLDMVLIKQVNQVAVILSKRL
jgi:hypothetical protein